MNSMNNVGTDGSTAYTDSRLREHRIYKVTLYGAIVNVLLCVAKLLAGIFGKSSAMIADGVHSLSDLITDIIVIAFVRISSKPQDRGHEYGHGKYETLATTIIGLMLLFVGGARSEFWGMAVLFACVKFLTLSDIERIMKFFFKFQFLNLACAAYQYHVLGYYQDFNNGAFLGGAYQNVFCALLFTYYFYKYIRHEDKLWKLVFVGLSGLYIAVVEEEKFIFIEFAGIIAYYFVSTGMNFAKILIMAGCVAAGVIALPILNSVNGQDSMEMLTSWDNFIGYATMTGYGYELPRLGSSSIISAKFFGDTTQDFFGLGLGMCGWSTRTPSSACRR